MTAKDTAQNILEGKVEDLDERFIQCRDLRHAWETQQDFYIYNRQEKGPAKTIARELACLRCGCERQEFYLLRPWGLEKLTNRYYYPESYVIKDLPEGSNMSQAIKDVQYARTVKRLGRLRVVKEPAHKPAKKAS